MIFKFYLMPTRHWARCRHGILWLFKIRYGIRVSDTCRASVRCPTWIQHSLWSVRAS